MLLDRYEQNGLLFNTNFKESAAGGAIAYRGELVLKQGEVADAQGRRKPPTAVLKQAVMLAEGDNLKLVSGFLDELQDLGAFFDLYQGDLKADTLAIFFVVNIPKPLLISAHGATLAAIPLVEGMVWNELIDAVGLEKGDFKGQSSAGKVLTLYQALLADFKPKYPSLPYAEALGTTIAVKREIRGAV